MIIRLVVTAALLLSGYPANGAVGHGPLTSGGATSTSTAGAVVTAEPAVDAAPTLTEVGVVVPPVDPSGTVVETPEVRAAQTDDSLIVVDTVTAGQRVQSDVVETGPFATLGVTWPGGGDAAALGAQVRTRSGGEWSGWQPLPEADDAPDTGTADAARAVRGGTDPLYVGSADAVQLSFAATNEGGPQDVRLALVGAPVTAPVQAAPASSRVEGTSGPERTTASAVFRTSSTSTTDGGTSGILSQATLKTTMAEPQVISRAQWGARNPACKPDVAAALVGAVVHHTADNKAYSTVAEAMAMIRADQTYHIDGRGWCDIGYNFVVDKWGNIYEGRANSMTQPVIGVHAGGFNTGTVGISMLGNYDVSSTPSAMIDAVGLIAGWRLSAYGVNPQGRINYLTWGGENSTVPAGTTINLPAIFAHRDVAATACPGRYGYAQMGNIRTVAGQGYSRQLFAESQSVVRALYQDLLGRGPDPTGLAGWSAALVSGTSQSELVGALTRSDEYIALRVTKAYNEVLGRGPDPQGAADWLAQIRAGYGTVDDVQLRFYGSQEFFLITGGTTAGYIQRLYTTMLRRGASDADVAAWAGVLASSGPAAMVNAIWFSTEAASVRAGDYYATFLGRGPDPTGLAGWTQVLLAYGQGAVRIGIAGSLEYRAKAIVRYP
ncbi:MAG: DUF4214 domain-containing protein [Cellulomonas sp.]